MSAENHLHLENADLSQSEIPLESRRKAELKHNVWDHWDSPIPPTGAKLAHAI